MMTSRSMWCGEVVGGGDVAEEAEEGDDEQG